MQPCRFFLSAVSLTILTVSSLWCQLSSDIRLNQIGFYPAMPKIAIVRNVSAAPFAIVSTTTLDTVFRGTLSSAQTWPYSNESVSRAEFTELQTPGTYRIVVPGLGTSYLFTIKPRIHLNVATAALKSYYYQRASMTLDAAYAGSWARAAGHPDNSVLIHQSAASVQRPANSTISAPRGWYDAGDYNKYIVNSGISTYTILAAYEHYPEFCDRLDTNIPESGNGVPDILDEALWNVRWMLAMQDPNDGGVYAKLTNANFDGFIMPAAATTPRYVVKKSTAAALDFAAVTAQAARITKKFSAALPGLSDSCLQASLKAWQWARNNPAVYYDQAQINAQYTPVINTGAYGDNNVSDEFAWAAAELCVTTDQDSFLTVASPLSVSWFNVPGWPDVRTLGLYTLAQHRNTLPSSIDTSILAVRLVTLANMLRNAMTTSAYRVVMGAQSSDFGWGSNSVAANQGMVLLMAFRMTGDTSYLRAALSNLDYLLGRNGTTFCFVTGLGSRSPLNIHHRPSASDGVQAPVPGLLAGGPNPRMEDSVKTYPSSLPALAYTDNVNSYASNEICINWNAPLVYLAIGIEAHTSPNGLPTSLNPDPSHQPIPGSYGLFQNYPNPFNPSTTIRYQIPATGHVTLKVFDTLGCEVTTLIDEVKSEGSYSVVFDGAHLSSGVYFGRLMAQSRDGNPVVETRKLVLTK
ncbi:MAG: glycoside hydrolase family 9 protein [bacterium]